MTGSHVSARADGVFRGSKVDSAPGTPRYPPREAVTFGEVMAAYETHGCSAARRYSHMSFASRTRFPDKLCTIADKVRTPRRGDEARLLAAARRNPGSRTPSPHTRVMRPCSAPATPRTSGRVVARPSERPDPALSSRGRAHEDRTLAPGHAQWSGVPCLREPQTPDDFSRREPRALERMSLAGFGREPSATAPAWSLRPEPPIEQEPAWPGFGSFGPEADYPPREPGASCAPQHSHRHLAQHVPCERGAAMKEPADARTSSFMRLNSFLLRTHVTSLVAALAEDGWIQLWEKDKLCAQSREATPSWCLSFLQRYSHLVETEDVQAFVAGLRAMIV